MRIFCRRSVLYVSIFLVTCLLIRFIQLRSSLHYLQNIEIEISEDVKLNQKQLIDLKDFRYMLKPNLDFYEVKAQFLGEVSSYLYFIKFTSWINV